MKKTVRKGSKVLSGIAAVALINAAVTTVYADEIESVNLLLPSAETTVSTAEDEGSGDVSVQNMGAENTDPMENGDTPVADNNGENETPTETPGESETDGSEEEPTVTNPEDETEGTPEVLAENGSGVALDSSNFPDPTLRNWLTYYDTDGDNFLSDSELANVTEVDVVGSDVETLKGLEYLTSLQYLYCYSNKITSIDLSKNPELVHLDCCDNLLTVLDVTNNKKLVYLCFGWSSGMTNGITYIDVTNNTELQELHAKYTYLPYIDVSGTKVDADDLYISGCKYVIPADTTTFDFKSIPGFDISKVSNVSGASFDPSTGVLSGITGNITYTYDCGNGISKQFTLSLGGSDTPAGGGEGEYVPSYPVYGPSYTPYEPGETIDPVVTTIKKEDKDKEEEKEPEKTYTVNNSTDIDVMKIEVNMEKYENSIDIRIEKNETPSANMHNKIAEYADKNRTSRYAYLPMDISVYDIETEKELKNLDEGAEITFFLAVPKQLYKYRNKIKVLHMNGDKLEVIDCTPIVNTKTGQKGIKFKMSSFSPTNLYVDADDMSDYEYEDIQSYAWITDKGEDVYEEDLSSGSGAYATGEAAIINSSNTADTKKKYIYLITELLGAAALIAAGSKRSRKVR